MSDFFINKVSDTVRAVFLSVAAVLLTAACSMPAGAPEPGRVPVASVDGSFLYYDELASVMMPDLTPEDSVTFADKYINNWISERLLYQNACRNISDTKEIDELVDSYRRSLIVHAYQQKLIEQKAVDKVREADIVKFYDENRSLFIVQEPIVKGVIIQLPLNAPNLSKVRSWYTSTKESSLDELEKYCILNAVRYEPFYETWTPLDQIEAILPPMGRSLVSSLAEKRNLEVRDNSYIYFLNVTDMVRSGEPEPIEKARLEIGRLLRNNNEVQFIEQMKQDLYNEALEKERIVFFNKDQK